MDWPTYQGIEVIVSEPASVRHPRYGYKRLSVLKDAQKLLLADGTELVVCDCGYNGITGNDPYVKPEGEQKDPVKQADSVLSHKNGTHNLTGPRKPLYTDEQIKIALKIWLKWRGTNAKNWTQAACDELDRLGFKPYRGEKWTTGQLGSLAREYVSKPKFRNLRPALVGAPITAVQDARSDEQTPAPVAVQEEEVVVPPTKTGDPVLTFAPSETDYTDLALTVVPESLAPRIVTGLPSVEIIPTDFVHVADLPDGSPMFTYKGQLMVGKLVKDVQI